jgi:predicted acyltransferase (DUF342 family)
MTGLVFLLPLLPALRELRLQEDISPVRIIQGHDGSAHYFADSFRAYLKHQIAARRAGREDALTKRTCCHLKDLNSTFEPSQMEAIQEYTDRLVVAAGRLKLPDRFGFNQEIFAKGDVMGGIRNRFRSVLAQGELLMGAKSQLLRWAHAYRIRVGTGSVILGRLTATHSIVFEPGCEFTRVNAGCVRFEEDGAGPASHHGGGADHRAEKIPASFLGAYTDGAGRALIGGDLDFPENGRWEGDLIVRGDARIRQGAEIKGSVKVYGKLHIEPDVRVAGAVVCDGMLIIARDCALRGPVVADQQIDIGAGTVIGASTARSTVTAPMIRVASRVTVYGTIWAKARGIFQPEST